MLSIGMTGVKLGDRLLQIGCADGARLAAIAGKVGLSGHAVAVVQDEAAATQVRKGAAAAGVLVEVQVASATTLPFEEGLFDLVLVDDANGLLASMTDVDRTGMTRELFRVLRPGGRAIVIGAGRRSGLSALFARAPAAPVVDPTALLETAAFRSVRKLAERDGLAFIEGVKPRG